MKDFFHTSVEGLYYFFNGNSDDENEVPYKEKRRTVIGWFFLLGFCIFMLSLLNNR
jgi:hypothetical protein